MRWCRVSSIENVQVVVAIQFENFKSKHEPLKDWMCLKRKGTVEVPFIFWDHFCTVNFSVRWKEIMRSLTQLANVICFKYFQLEFMFVKETNTQNLHVLLGSDELPFTRNDSKRIDKRCERSRLHETFRCRQLGAKSIKNPPKNCYFKLFPVGFMSFRTKRDQFSFDEWFFILNCRMRLKVRNFFINDDVFPFQSEEKGRMDKVFFFSFAFKVSAIKLMRENVKCESLPLRTFFCRFSRRTTFQVMTRNWSIYVHEKNYCTVVMMRVHHHFGCIEFLKLWKVKSVQDSIVMKLLHRYLWIPLMNIIIYHSFPSELKISFHSFFRTIEVKLGKSFALISFHERKFQWQV